MSLFWSSKVKIVHCVFRAIFTQPYCWIMPVQKSETDSNATETLNTL